MIGYDSDSRVKIRDAISTIVANDAKLPYVPSVEPVTRVRDEELINKRTRVVVLNDMLSVEHQGLHAQARSLVADYYAMRAFLVPEGTTYERKMAKDAWIKENHNRAAERAFRELALDEYDAHGRAITVVTVTDLPEMGGKFVSGTVRLVQGKLNGAKIPPLDAMSLVTPIKWPHLDRGNDVFEIGELSRFVIPPWARGNMTSLTSMLYNAAAVEARQRNIRTLYAIMPVEVVSILSRANIGISEIVGTQLNFQADNASEEFPLAVSLADAYPNYWIQSDPRLYLFDEYDRASDLINCKGHLAHRRLK